MEAHVMSRAALLERAPDPEIVLISIQNPDIHYKRKVNLYGWHATLRLEFHDVSAPKSSREVKFYKERKYIIFSAKMAEEVRQFIDSMKPRTFYIHCDAGISRSVAVGYFLQTWHGYYVIYHETGEPVYRNALVCNELARPLIEDKLNP